MLYFCSQVVVGHFIQSPYSPHTFLLPACCFCLHNFQNWWLSYCIFWVIKLGSTTHKNKQTRQVEKFGVVQVWSCSDQKRIVLKRFQTLWPLLGLLRVGSIRSEADRSKQVVNLITFIWPFKGWINPEWHKYNHIVFIFFFYFYFLDLVYFIFISIQIQIREQINKNTEKKSLNNTRIL